METLSTKTLNQQPKYLIRLEPNMTKTKRKTSANYILDKECFTKIAIAARSSESFTAEFLRLVTCPVFLYCIFGVHHSLTQVHFLGDKKYPMNSNKRTQKISLNGCRTQRITRDDMPSLSQPFVFISEDTERSRCNSDKCQWPSSRTSYLVRREATLHSSDGTIDVQQWLSHQTVSIEPPTAIWKTQ